MERRERSPGFKLGLAIAIGMLLAIPIFSVWFLVYDRQSQANEARTSIAAGWGGAQAIAGPMLVIPYRATASETVVENGQSVTRSRDVLRELTLAPEAATIDTAIKPELRKRAIYEAVVYQSQVSGSARFVLPPDIVARRDRPRSPRAWPRRAALRDQRPARPWRQPARRHRRPGGAAPARRRKQRRARILRLRRRDHPPRPARSPSNSPSRFAAMRRSACCRRPATPAGRSDRPGRTRASAARFSRRAGKSSESGFEATYRIGNLALGRSLATLADAGASTGVERVAPPRATIRPSPPARDSFQAAQVSLIQPVDPYSQVDRAAKYGFLFIGFTFLALLMFDVVGGVRVAPVEYLLMGAALVLFFVLLLAFAEIIGFTPAYVLAAAAIAGLNTAYSAAVLKSWRRAAFIGGLLVGLYAVLYILLSLEAYSLLIGSVMTFLALAGVMYATRRIDWSGGSKVTE